MKRLDPELARFAILHHSAHEPRPGISARAYRDEIRRWHLERGFHDIGYHYVVKGKAFEKGRPLEYQGAHCLRFNDFSIGICVAGDLTKRSPTQDEVATVVSAILDAEYELGHKFQVVGHNDVADTLCPGVELVGRVQGYLHKIAKNSAL